MISRNFNVTLKTFTEIQSELEKKPRGKEILVVEEILDELKKWREGDSPHKRHSRGELEGTRDVLKFLWRGKQYVYYRVRASPGDIGAGSLAMPCHPVCGGSWNRPHFTCLAHCIGRQVWYGELPPAFHYKTWSIVVNPFRPRWKVVATKLIATILEWAAS